MVLRVLELYISALKSQLLHFKYDGICLSKSFKPDQNVAASLIYELFIRDWQQIWRNFNSKGNSHRRKKFYKIG